MLTTTAVFLEYNKSVYFNGLFVVFIVYILCINHIVEFRRSITCFLKINKFQITPTKNEIIEKITDMIEIGHGMPRRVSVSIMLL